VGRSSREQNRRQTSERKGRKTAAAAEGLAGRFPAVLPTRPQEQLLIDAVAQWPAGRLLCNTVGRGQLARAYAAAHPTGEVDCWFLDVHQRDLAATFSPIDQTVSAHAAEDSSAAFGEDVPLDFEDAEALPPVDSQDEDDAVVDSTLTDHQGAALDDVADAVAGHAGAAAEEIDDADAADDSEADVTVSPDATFSPESVEIAARQTTDRGTDDRCHWLCTADPPEREYDCVAWCASAKGDGELTREMLQLGYQRLATGGRMFASIDQPEDQWLHTELRKLFAKVTREPCSTGVRYAATKLGPLAKVKHYDSEFAFRDQGRLIHAVSRPGVFSHRQLDGGARALVNAMPLVAGQRVLDLGCGSGVVGLAVLAREPTCTVLAVDANPRALECAELGAKRNELTGLSTSLDATGLTVPQGEFDLVLANPPYFSQYRIAWLFLRVAHRALKPNGQVLVVTKTPHWFEEQMPELFREVTVMPAKAYSVVVGIRGRTPAAAASTPTGPRPRR
jgi:16S rRNA G1207 methylase RsmC